MSYPKALYHREASGAVHTHVVQTEADHQALGEGWYESLADVPPE